MSTKIMILLAVLIACLLVVSGDRGCAGRAGRHLRDRLVDGGGRRRRQQRRSLCAEWHQRSGRRADFFGRNLRAHRRILERGSCNTLSHLPARHPQVAAAEDKDHAAARCDRAAAFRFVLTRLAIRGSKTF